MNDDQFLAIIQRLQNIEQMMRRELERQAKARIKPDVPLPDSERAPRPPDS